MKRILATFFVPLVILGFSSCYGEPEPGTTKVIVVDQNDFRVPSANVQLSQPGQLGNGPILNLGITDMNGEYSYTHEPALEVILNISAEKDGDVGQGIVRITPGETTTVTVKIF